MIGYDTLIKKRPETKTKQKQHFRPAIKCADFIRRNPAPLLHENTNHAKTLIRQAYMLTIPHNEAAMRQIAANVCSALRTKNSIAYIPLKNRLNNHTPRKNRTTNSIKEHITFNKGVIALRNKEWKLAADLYLNIINKEPNSHASFHNLAICFDELGNTERAISLVEKALQIDPMNTNYLSTLSVLFEKTSKADSAIAYLLNLYVLDRSNHKIASRLLKLVTDKKYYCLGQDIFEELEKVALQSDDLSYAFARYALKTCNFKYIKSWQNLIEEKIERDKIAVNPFQLLLICDNQKLIYKNTVRYAKKRFPKKSSNTEPLHFAKASSLGLIKKPRIAYIGGSFHAHPGSHLITEIFEHQNTEKYEYWAFSFGKIRDEMTGRIAKCFGKNFLICQKSTEYQIASTIKNIGIDIAVSLRGYDIDARPGIFSHRPAPIQVAFLGYPNTLGVDYIDYIIADETVLPDQNVKFFSEKPIYLPHSYQPNPSIKFEKSRSTKKSEHNLPENAFIFCSFNQLQKITFEIFSLWMRIMQSVPASVLWLLTDHQTIQQRLLSFAGQYNITPERIIFAPLVKHSQHLERHRHADLILDTLPYNAHTCATDALRMSVPVLTCVGDSFQARVAASLLKTIGLDELITTNLESYSKLAIKIATDQSFHKSIQNKLNINKTTCELFNPKLFSEHLEIAYEQILNRKNNQLAPEAIFVKNYL